MKFFRMLRIPLVLLAAGGVLMLSPFCKAQEVSPDHFTATGVEDIYQAAPHKVVAPKPKQTSPSLQARNHRTDSPTTLQLTATRNSSSPAQPSPLAISERRKPALRKPEKP